MITQVANQPLAVMIKGSAFKPDKLKDYYINPMIQLGLRTAPQDIRGYDLPFNGKKAPAVSKIKEYLDGLAGDFKENGTKYILICDGAYFKVLTGNKKAEPFYGYAVDATYQGFEGIKVVLCPNYQALMYNDSLMDKVDMALRTLVDSQKGTLEHLGHNVIQFAEYPTTGDGIADWLTKLHTYDELTCDIEAYSLKHYDAGLGTISFAWNKHEGIAFNVDAVPYLMGQNTQGFWSERVINIPTRMLLKTFFTTYQGKLIFHNATYDVKVLIYQLWMDDILDHHGLLEGLEVFEDKIHCTRIISYLATNNCSQNSLSLKDQAHEFTGNYAQEDIKDIRLIEPNELLEYNLMDCCATWFVWEKNYPQMVADQQEELYLGLFHESLITIIQMELTGMPMCMQEVHKGTKELQKIHDDSYRAIVSHPFTIQTQDKIQIDWIDKDYETRRDKAKNPDKIKPKDLAMVRAKPTGQFPQHFNPNSGQQLAKLLFETIGLPVLDTTPTGQPKTDDDTLKALRDHTTDSSTIQLIEDIRTLLGVDKILGTFIPQFLKAKQGPDGWHYLFGSFNLGGTKSGRLSASDPNMQQIPSGSTYAKVIKKMFQPPTGWLFGGSDYASLEDRINTLLTKDPNKIKVYTDKYDGHSLRAFNYFPNELVDIHEEYNKAIANGEPKEKLVEIVNSIDDKYSAIRQKSKAPTFALTYQGTWSTLVKNCGFTNKEAKEIEANYHKMYEVSDVWVQDKLQEASDKGYITLAYGLRLRTPLLKKVYYGSRNMPKEAGAEARTAGNAVSGQSYGLITTKAANEFMLRVRKSKYRYDIRIAAQIHDAIYLVWRNEAAITNWVNDNLYECMCDQTDELPEIQHPEVKLDADLDIFWPHWASALTLKKRGMDDNELMQLCSDFKYKYENPEPKKKAA